MLRDYLETILGGEDLSRREAEYAMEMIITGRAAETQVAAFLAALRLKGETAAEITGFAETMRRHATTLPYSGTDLVDTCGTGGDKKATFNVSTTTAFVLAGGNVRVAKHGNRGVSSPCGSADVLAALNVAIDLPPEQVSQAIQSIGIGFLFAPRFHPAMGNVAKLRRELGTRTVFNLLGPLTNPAGAPRQLLGVYDRRLTVKLAQVLLSLGVEHALVIHSHDGMDEISSRSPSYIVEVKAGQIMEYEIDPLDYGFSPDAAEYQGGSSAENAALLVRILEGEEGPCRDIVLLNAAAGFIVSGKALDFSEGLQLAKQSIDSGAALSKLRDLQAFSRSGCAS